MQLAILTRNARLYTTKRLVQAIRSRGHDAQLINPFRVTLFTHPWQVRQGRRVLAIPKGGVIRLGSQGVWPTLALARHLQAMGTHWLNELGAMDVARDKWHTLQRLTQAGIPVPPTFTNVAASMSGWLRQSPEWVIKSTTGLQGTGVMLAPSYASAIGVADALRGMRVDSIVQPYYTESMGQDIRCLVIDGQVVASMIRTQLGGDFRSNVHQGGVAQPVIPTPLECEMAIESARAIDLMVAGVDIIRTHSGPMVLEVNASPGLEGIESVHTPLLAELMIDALLRRLS